MLTEFARTVSSAGVAAGETAFRPARAAVGLARTTERRARDRAADDIGRAAVALVDRVLASPYAETAMRHALESELAERLASRVLEGPELDRIAALAVESASLRAEAALASAEFERLVSVTLQSAGMERVVAQVLSSRVVEDAVTRLIDDAVARMPDSEPLWTLIDVIAQSPVVTEAISQQGAGFADQVAGQVRDRTRTIDDRLEHGAHRLFRRRTKGSGPGGPEPSAAGAT